MVELRNASPGGAGVLNRILLAILLPLILNTLACSRPHGLPPERIVRNAPQSQSEAGVIVSGVRESELLEALEQLPQALVRPIYPPRGMYELQYVSVAMARKALPQKNIRIFENVYIHMNEQARNLQTIQAARRSLDDGDDFVRACSRFERNDSTVQVQISKPLDRFEISHLVERGETVTASLAETPAHEQFIWRIQPPAESALAPVVSQEAVVRFTPDVGGEYAVLVIVKNKSNVCTITRKSVYATANPTLDPSQQFSPKERASIDLGKFWHVESLQLSDIWKLSTGRRVRVALIDTGVNYNHPALAQNIWRNEDEIPNNGVDDDQNGFVDDTIGYDFASTDAFPFDDQGHGSHIAGLIASSVFGVAPSVSIMPIKVLTGLGLDLGSFIGGIYYAVDNGAEVINASFGFTQDHPAFRDAIVYAQQKNVTIVAAAGNGDAFGMGVDNDDNPSYPCNYDLPNIISVTATNESGDLATYGNYGKRSVDIATFGGTVDLPMASTARQNQKGQLWTDLYGTSQATPLVAGAAALLLERNPSLTPLEVKNILIQTSHPKPSLRGKTVAEGTLNPLAALLQLPTPTRLMSSHQVE